MTHSDSPMNRTGPALFFAALFGLTAGFQRKNARSRTPITMVGAIFKTSIYRMTASFWRMLCSRRKAMANSLYGT